MSDKDYRISTTLVHQGRGRDPYTGAANIPVYLASTYHHAKGVPGEWEYARVGNPSREQVERAAALLDGGCAGFAYASGMAAIAGALSLLRSGDHLLSTVDLYGGTYRYLTNVLPGSGVDVEFIEMTDLSQLERSLRENARCIFMETPSNPLFRITDIRKVTGLARQKNILTILDNTFMTPLYQKPLELGVDIAVQSGTKFLGGHSDILAGIAVTGSEEIAGKLRANLMSTGAVLAPFDSFLLSRGMKTLKVRYEAAENTAGVIAGRLSRHRAVERVYYPGLDGFPGRELHLSQSGSCGPVLSFDLADPGRAAGFMERLELPVIAPSLGGVETIVTHCWSMSHAGMPADVKRDIGIGEGLFRISCGLEDPEDLWEDLEAALES